MELTAQQAAATLHDLEDVEERLTARTAGLTHLVWGMAAPLIFLTYGSADALVQRHEAWWAFSVLWIPGALLGALLTHHLWNHNALRLDRPTDGRRDLRVLAYIAAVLALGATLWLTTNAVGQTWTVSTTMTIANGLLAILIGLIERRGGVPCTHHALLAGIGILLGGILLVLFAVPDRASTLLGAAITSLGWTLAGLMMIRRG